MKHITTILVLLVGVALTGIGLWVWKMPHAVGSVPPVSVSVQPQVAAVDRSTRDIQALTAVLTKWQGASPAEKTVELIAEAPRSQQQKLEQSKVAASLKQPVPAHQISMIYLSSTMQRAIVDGHYIGPGDSLPDGTKVVAIRRGQVVLWRKGRREVVQAQPVPVGVVQ